MVDINSFVKNGTFYEKGFIYDKYKRFIKYLDCNYCKKPYSIVNISQDLDIEIAEVIEYFSVIKDTFRLFHKIQHEKIIRDEDIFSNSYKKTKKIQLTKKDIEELSSYEYLSSKRLFITQKLFKKAEFLRLSELISKYPLLFIQNDSGIWTFSEPGKYFTTEYLRYKRINIKVDKLFFNNIELKIIT